MTQVLDPTEVEIFIAYYHPDYFPAWRLPALLQELQDGSRVFAPGKERELPGRIAALEFLINNPYPYGIHNPPVF